MSEILLVNKRSRKRRASAKRTKVHRRRKGRMPAALKRYWAGIRGRKSNPTRKRRRHHARVRVRRSRYRSNPSLRLGAIGNSLIPTVKAGALGATGALMNDLLWGYTKGYLPASLQGGNIGIAARALYAVLTGVVGNYVLKGKGRALADGAMTVVLHDAGKAVLHGMLPTLPLGEYMSMAPAVGYSPRTTRTSLDTYVPVGEYLADTSYTNGIPTGGG